jgi:hypothetical protein
MRATDPPEAPVNRTSLFLISVLSIILGILLGILERRKGRMCLFENFVFGCVFMLMFSSSWNPNVERTGYYFGPTGGPSKLSEPLLSQQYPVKLGKPYQMKTRF